ncbi:MAG: DUF1569 domain-containing protein [Pedobacter sp.]|nr:MAG: DUF1569 domain-containing protein [Pedobacter sp.]
MTTDKINLSILKIVDTYKEWLTDIDETRFQETPPIGGWSYSEVYMHIFDSNLLSLLATQNCIKGNGKEISSLFLTKLILFFGSLPPGKRYKVPKRLESRVKKIDLAAAHQLIFDFELQWTKTLPQTRTANPKITVPHPRLGNLNANEWLRFIEIHFNHHLKQLSRIKNSFLQNH